MPSGVFITGTDTGVGKTLVSCLLAKALREQGRRVGVMKPVETGCPRGESGELLPADGEALLRAAASGQDLHTVVPFRFQSPVAPSVAVAHEGKKIDLERLVELIASERERFDSFLVEGAGGLLVPIQGSYTFADLAEEAALPLLIVVGSRLGALNHAALTFEVARSRRLPVLGYVLNTMVEPEKSFSPGITTASETNRATLKGIAERCGIAELAEIPFFGRMVLAAELPATHAADGIAKAVIESS